MILIEENFENIITEASNDGKKTYLMGCFMEHSAKNRNGRIYSPEQMQDVVLKINDAAERNMHILSELDHPNTLEVKLANVSHRLMSAEMRGNQVWCKAEILEKHPKGAILKSLVDSDVRVGMSSRGGGKVNQNTGEVEYYKFICCDAVATPSCRNAYPETVEEQLQEYARGGVIDDLSEAIQHDALAQKYFEIEMKKFIEAIYKG